MSIKVTVLQGDRLWAILYSLLRILQPPYQGIQELSPIPICRKDSSTVKRCSSSLVHLDCKMKLHVPPNILSSHTSHSPKWFHVPQNWVPYCFTTYQKASIKNRAISDLILNHFLRANQPLQIYEAPTCPNWGLFYWIKLSFLLHYVL